MTTKTIKTALFAVMILSIAVPLASYDNLAYGQVGKTDLEIVQEHATAYNQLQTEKQEKLKTLDEKRQSQAPAGDVKQIEDRLTEIDNLMKKHQAVVQEMNLRGEEEMKMDPKLEKDLYAAQQIIFDSGMPWQTISVDHKSKQLEILIDAKGGYEQKVKDLLPPGIPFHVSYGKFYADSCSGQFVHCTTLGGGLAIAAGVPPTVGCTLSLPVVQGTTQGFLTAGHCFASSTNIFQPWKTSGSATVNKIGSVTSRVLGGSCDCEFITKSGADSITSGIYLAPDTWHFISSKADAHVGDWVDMTGVGSGGVKHGQVIAVGVPISVNGIPVSGAVQVQYFESTGTDSGAPINAAAADIYHGSVSGHTTGYTYYIPWSNIHTNLLVS